MSTTCLGQLILGADRHNPLFTVYAHAEDDQDCLHVYYGLGLLEVMSADPNAPSYELLVGRLYNAGFKLTVLQRTFGRDPQTIRPWGRALQNPNLEELIRVLEGRRAQRKFTPEIQAYVRVRWPDLVRERRYGVGQRLRQEIEIVPQPRGRRRPHRSR
jgi:hypothetical protein